MFGDALSLTTLPLWLGSHFLGDFILGQSPWTTRQKSRLWIAIVAHAAAYATTFAVVGATSDWLSLSVLFLTHLTIDSVKARWGLSQRFFHWLLPWSLGEVREYLARSTKPFHEADASTAVIKARTYRVDGHAMYVDQVAHFVVLLGLFFTRGQGWL